jgi:hypothetical protein
LHVRELLPHGCDPAAAGSAGGRGGCC